MRVIGGELRGKKLHCLAGRDIRPTADRLREAIFNILGEEVRGARVLDLFAGTGALAIEALSRGARSAVLIDRSRAAVKLIRRNLAACRLDERTRVICWDIRRDLNCLSSRPCGFDLVFMDPPYGRDSVMPALDVLLASGVLAENACLVVEHAVDEAVAWRRGLRLDDQRRYGRTRVTFLVAGNDNR
jgi:16S rRNA (guanine966-N2)-methyltransferase